MGSSALILLDIQNGVLNRVGDTGAYLDRVASTIKAARDAGVRVIYVVACFREGYPEASPRLANMSKQPGWAPGTFTEGHESTEFPSIISPEKGDIIVKKRRVSAFHATDLDMILRTLDIKDIVVTGLITSGAVLSTVRQAADLDYRQVVLEDLCMDREKETHDLLMKLYASMGQVIPSSEWVAGLQKPSA